MQSFINRFSTYYFLILLCFGVLSCNSNEPEDEINGPPTTGNFFYGILDGEEILVTAANGYGAATNSCDAENFRIVNGAGWPIVQLSRGAYIYIDQNSPIESSDHPQFRHEMFAEGSVGYEEIAACNSDIRSVAVSWDAPDGNQWSSSQGEQQGSYFTIEELGPIQNDNSAIVKGRFGCTLYFNNESKSLESGEFSMLISLY